MVPYFNTSGPCVAGQHYMLPPERRLTRALELVEQGRFFTLHAGRQTGKTTSARWLVRSFNAPGGRYDAAWVDLQTAREQPDLGEAMREVLLQLDRALGRDLPQLERPGREAQDELLRSPTSAVLEYLRQLAAAATRPLVVLFDEADGLVGRTMVSFLTQLRAGYTDRSDLPFPHSVALIGMRQVRDYVLASEDRRTVSWLGTTSPFNITAEAQTLAPFTADEVVELLGQHTAATGQPFEAAAAARVHALSAGQPWLVNALADQVVRDERDVGVAVTAAHVEAAKETIILERRTHIDSLVARLREERVRRIVEPMLTGGSLPFDGIEDDLHYVVGLGLVSGRDGQYSVANPIYREVIPRALTFAAQVSLAQESSWYVAAEGGLDVDALLRAFQRFWREDGHLAAEGFGYREAGPHLMLMAFLQRIVNSGGRVEREYGLGRRRLDLIVEWGAQRYVIEVKLRRGTETEQEAAEQLVGYLEGLGLDRGWLVLFDLRKGPSWEERIVERELELAGKRVCVLGC